MTKRLSFSICLYLIHLIVIAQTSAIRHTVKKGENVYRISLKYGVSMQSIFESNPGSEDKILAGEILTIPDANASSNSRSSTANTVTNSDASTYRVRPGDTKFGLSKKFGMSIAELERLNPHIKNMLQSGHILQLSSSAGTSTVAGNYNTSATHIVTKGETLFGISNNYGIPLQSLVKTNSIENPDLIYIGQVLNVSKAGATVASNSEQEQEEEVPEIIQMDEEDDEAEVETTTSEPVISDEVIADNSVETTMEEDLDDATEEVEAEEEIVVETPIAEPEATQTPTLKNNKEAYINYTVKAQETLYGLSREANMTISELLALNPEMKAGVKKGMVIQMPNPDFVGNKEEVSRVSYNTYVGTSIPDLLFSATKVTENTVRFYLPFSLEEYKSFLIQKDSAIFKTRRNKKSIEFYQGGSLAIKNLNSLGLNFVAEFFNDKNIQIENSDSSAIEKKVVMFPYLTSFSSISDERLSDAIEVVNIDSEASIKNTKAYNALPTLETQQRTTLNYLRKRDGNVIAISDAKRSTVRELIENTLVSPTIVDVDSNGLFDENTVLSNLDKNKMNYVILDSEKSVLFLNATNILLKALSNYQINLVLLDKALFPKEFNVSTKRFNILKTIYPSVHQITTTPNQLKFKAQYEQMYGEAPSKEAIFGFDITMDVMLRLSQFPKFEETINSLKTEYLNLKFDYKKVTPSSYENQGVFLYQYDGYDKINELN